MNGHDLDTRGKFSRLLLSSHTIGVSGLTLVCLKLASPAVWCQPTHHMLNTYSPKLFQSKRTQARPCIEELCLQGWRLDPLLLFVQICLAGTAFTWALEAIKLRKEVDQAEVSFPSAERRF